MSDNNLESILESSLPEKIYKYHESKNGDWRRAHLGCSVLGGKCDRAIWYGFRWVKKSSFDGRMLRLFETGQLAEDRLVAELQGIGIEVSERQKWVNLAAHISGSIDGLGLGFEESKKIHLLEFKTHNAKSFALLKKEGVQKSKPQHYCQMQLYMGGLFIERAYYIAVNKDTDEIYAERVKFNKQDFEALIERGNSIINSINPPQGISDNPAWYECKFCDYKEICFESTKPEVNCRTCCHSTPCKDGKWTCDRDNGIIDIEFQKEGCEYHVFLPKLLNQEPVDSGKDFIRYETWTNGKDYTKSVDYEST